MATTVRHRLDPQRYYRLIALVCAILASGGNLIIPRFALAALAIVFGLAAIDRKDRAPEWPKALLIGWLAMAIGFSFVREQNIDIVSNIIRIANFIMALVLLRVYSGSKKANFVSDYIFIVRPMVYTTILTVLIAVIAPGIFSTASVGNAKFQTFLIFFNYHSAGLYTGPFVRPDGLFYEPGVLQIYLNIYLFFVLSSQRLWRAALPALIAIVCTQSTTGILIASAILAYFGIGGMFARGTTSRKLIGVLTAVLLAFPVAIYAQENIQAKLYGKLKGSATARNYDLESGILIVKSHPIIGIGFNNDEYIRESLILNPHTDMLSIQHLKGRSSTNGILMALYSLGIPLGAFYLFMISRQTFSRNRMLLSGILLVGLTTQALTFSAFYALFAFDGMIRTNLAKDRSAVRLRSGVPRRR